MAPPLYNEVIIACLMPTFNPALQADFLVQYEPLINYMREKWTSTAFRTTVESLNLKSENRPRVILMVNENVTKIGYVNLRSELAKYVETGGTLILCCWFPTKSTTWGINALLWEFKCNWTVKEGLEGFVRTNLTLNPALKQTIGDNSFNYLEPIYAIEAVHIQGVSVADQVYLASSEQEYTSVGAVDPNAEGTPSAFRKHGRGFLGYVGDIGLQSGTQALILSMIQAGAPAALLLDKQAFAGPTIKPPTDLAHAAPPTKYNMSRPVLHNDPAGVYPPIVRQAPGKAETTTEPISKGSVPDTRPSTVLHVDNPSDQPHSETASSESTMIITCDTVKKPSPRQSEIGCQNAEPKARNNTTAVQRFPLSVSSGCTEETSEEGGVPVGTTSAQYVGPDPVGAPLSENDSDIEMNDDTPMPGLRPCDTGCIICTKIFPAYHCIGCDTVQYCSVDCQAEDWPEHKLLCAFLSKV